MKKDIFYVLVALFSLGLTGCDQLVVDKYENDPRLYFFKGYDRVTQYTQGDSLVQSFFLLPEGQRRDTVYMVIETMGMTSDQPRPIRLVQKNAGAPNAAVAGKHYVAFDSQEMRELLMIPAGSAHYYFPLIVLWDPSLESSKVRLQLAVAENDYFKVGIEKQSEFLVTITALAEKPANWNTWSYQFGDFGVKKMWFLIHYVGVTDFSKYPDDSSYATYLSALAVKKLREYNADENNPDRPLREADGTVVKFKD